MWAIGKWITDNILNVLGATGNTGGTATAGTAMAKLNKLLTDYTTTRAGYLDYLANGTYGLSALNTKITNLTNSATGAVKSVQRGVHDGEDESNITINISSVNPAKCHVTVYQRISSYSYNASSSSGTYYYVYFPYVVSLTGTALTVARSCYGAGSNDSYSHLRFSWEIVEYY